MAVQPDVLVEQAKKQEWTERGGSARFLYAMPKGRVGSRTGTGRDMPESVEHAYAKRLLELLPHQPPTSRADRPADPTVMRLDASARAAWEAFYERFEPRLHPDAGDLGWCRAWGGKFPGALARIAALLQLAQHGPGDVGIEATQRALELAPYLEAHATAALTAANEKPGLKDARRVIQWLQSTGVDEFTERDVYRVNFGQDKDRTADACEVLEDLGWIRRSAGARSDSARWEAHPQIRQVSAVSALSYPQDNSTSEPSSLSFSSTKPKEPNQPTSGNHDSGTSETLTLLTLEERQRAEAEAQERSWELHAQQLQYSGKGHTGGDLGAILGQPTGEEEAA